MNPNKNYARNFCEWFMVGGTGLEPVNLLNVSQTLYQLS